MRSKISCVIILSALWVFACDFPGLLSGDDSRNPHGDPDVTADTLLYVHTTGGFAGVTQNLVVRKSGGTHFTDSFRGHAEWKVQFSDDRLADLERLFVNNGFFVLAEEYVEPHVADAFFFDIQYFKNDSPHTVVTNYFGAPDNLKKIVDGISDLIEAITEEGLGLELELSASEIEQGSPVELGLNVTNQSSETMTLKFDTGQIFDFCVPGGNDLIWNWAHDQVFTQQIRQIELGAGESRSYMVEWDGRNNKGEPVAGDMVIVGKLVSLPGGTSPQKFLHISE